MEYRQLGETGTEGSVLGLGRRRWVMFSGRQLPKKKLVVIWRSTAGINFFDVAVLRDYTGGERLVEALEAARQGGAGDEVRRMAARSSTFRKTLVRGFEER